MADESTPTEYINGIRRCKVLEEPRSHTWRDIALWQVVSRIGQKCEVKMS
ncbi:predicted protein [Plenodomus lingam JN3]|uniref:Predicted protein n=1 Tax=Leptosphaeria maculans (strain JN3 / isolate v23.1.3 / race Av1-4-5-6-7-8) TaxID=985895 RepID=E5A4A0_LEPMJ|nr:predicted protein [Plenodomus lingam JN3]CBX98445.1 predicted protein [Plenodomus lingam JN3]